MIRTALVLLLIASAACSRSEPQRSGEGVAPTESSPIPSGTPSPDGSPGPGGAPADSAGSPAGTATGSATGAGSQAVAAGTAAAAGAPSSAPGAAAVEPATPPPSGPIPVPVTSAVALVGTESRPLAFDAPNAVDPAARFQVELAVPLIDARLALVDADDALVAAAESHEIGATWSRFLLVPDAPLRPGTKYALRIDGASDREAHDADGRAYQITVWELRTTGEPPPPEPAPRKAKRRR